MKKIVKVGSVAIGDDSSVKIQSMANIKTEKVFEVVNQITDLQNAGCDIIRVSVLDERDALAINEIKKRINIPIVADIHFDYRLAIKSIDSGADKIRINPGNIGSEKNIIELSNAIKSNGVAVRVGSNSGSIEKNLLSKYGRSHIALVESALNNVSILEKQGVDQIVISTKASSVKMTVDAYEYLSKKTDYPLHVGVTEAGTYDMGIVKSSIGIGSLLLKGIGDTIRVSLTGDPKQEIEVAKRILRGIGLDKNFVEVISCPTCGRTSYDSIGLANRVEQLTSHIKKPLKVAVMGCVVNGPGEASDCDIGIAGGNGSCVIFKQGKVYKKVDMAIAEEEFIKEIQKIVE